MHSRDLDTDNMDVSAYGRVTLNDVMSTFYLDTDELTQLDPDAVKRSRRKAKLQDPDAEDEF
jgi:hypothetical protein